MAAVWGSTAELNSQRVCKHAWLTETRDFIQRDYCHHTLRGLYQRQFPNRAFLDRFFTFPSVSSRLEWHSRMTQLRLLSITGMSLGSMRHGVRDGEGESVRHCSVNGSLEGLLNKGFCVCSRFYTSPYSIATNRMISQTSLTPYIASPVSAYQVCTPGPDSSAPCIFAAFSCVFKCWTVLKWNLSQILCSFTI